MADGELSYPIGDAVRGTTLVVEVRVTGTRLFAVRMWFAQWLFWLGAKVGGFRDCVVTPTAPES